jgi:tryptophanyl-tRNA synthetase
MSKSDADKTGCILLTDSATVIEQKVMRAVTDSGSVVEATDDKPALTNLLQIFSLVSGRDIAQLEQDYAGKGYGQFKADLARAVVDELIPLQRRFQELLDDRSTIDTALREGRQVAGDLAARKIAQVKAAVGLLPS